MNRRNFLFNTGIVGAGLLGAGNAAPGLLRAGTATNSDSNLTLEEKPVAFTLPPLPYSFDALEPYIDAKTMEIHHDKHHGAYVANLNKALEGQAALQAKSLDDLLKGLDSIPENIRNAVRNNGGGHWNHTLFWTLMKKGGGGEPKGNLTAAINSAVGFFSRFLEKICSSGSGPLWFRMGMAGGPRRETGYRLHAKSGHSLSPFGRRQSRSWAGRLGTRLLSEVSEPARGLHQGLVERRQLGQSRRTLRRREEIILRNF